MASATNLQPSTSWLIARGTVAVVVGLLVGGLSVFLIETASHLYYKIDADVAKMSPAEMAEFVKTLPFGAFAAVFAAWVVGTFLAAFVAAWIGRRAPLVHAAIPAALLLAATAFNLILIPHPLWMAIAAPPALIVAAWLGARAGAPRPALSP